MHSLAPKIGTISVFFIKTPMGEIKTVGRGCRMRPEGPKIEAEGRERGGVLGEGQLTALPSLGERCELCQRGSGRSPDCPKVFHYFQHSGWPLLTL